MTDPQVNLVLLSFITYLWSTGGFPSMDTGTRKCNSFFGTNLGDCPRNELELLLMELHQLEPWGILLAKKPMGMVLPKPRPKWYTHYSKKHLIIPVCIISAWSYMCRDSSHYTNVLFSLSLQVMLVSFMKQDRSIISIRVLHHQQLPSWWDGFELSQAITMAAFSIMDSRLSSLRAWRVCDLRRGGPAETTTNIFVNQHEAPKNTYICNSMAHLSGFGMWIETEAKDYLSQITGQSEAFDVVRYTIHIFTEIISLTWVFDRFCYRSLESNVICYVRL